MFENRARRYLEDPKNHGVIRGDLEVEKELLQKELDLIKKHRQCDVTGTASGYREGDEERRVRFGRQGRGAIEGKARSE